VLGLVLQPLVLSSFQLVGLTGRPGLSGSKPKLRSRTRTRSGEELKWDGSGYWPPKKSVHSQVDKISHQLPPGLLATMSTEVTDAHMLNNGFRILNTISLCVSLQAAWPPCLATGSSRLRPCNKFPLTSFGSSRCPLPARLTCLRSSPLPLLLLPLLLLPSPPLPLPLPLLLTSEKEAMRSDENNCAWETFTPSTSPQSRKLERLAERGA